MKKRVLVLAPGKKTRGGITSVVKLQQQTEIWQKWNCIWIETYIDTAFLSKLIYFLISLTQFMVLLPAAQLVHIHLSEPTSALRKSFYFNLAKFFSKVVIIHFHAFSPNTTLLGTRQNLYKKLFNRADYIIVLSNYWKEQVEKLIGQNEKIHVIYNPCPSVKINGRVKKQKQILFAGTLNNRKGYIDLLQSFGKIAHKYSTWKLVFAGNGEIHLGKKQAHDLDITSQVEFHGWVNGEEKALLFNQTSIFCLPSYNEGFPMAILDAWAYGLPVITTPVGGLSDILIHGENAMIFPPGDIKSLALNLEVLMNNPELCDKLSKQSLLLASNQFNLVNISEQINQLYGLLVSKKK